MREANRSVRHGEKLIMTNSLRSSYITSQSRCTETRYLLKKRGKGRSGQESGIEGRRVKKGTREQREKRREEKRREEKRREEKRREEKRREEKRREEECREKLYTYCDGETNLRLLRFQGTI